MRILLVEDDHRMARLIEEGCVDHNIDVMACSDVASSVRQADAMSFDVIVVDVGLPDGSGLELCQSFRAAGLQTPILICTALDAVQDRVDGLDAGADDYLTKPFAFVEFLARIRSLSRRVPGFLPDQVTVGDFDVDLRGRTVVRAGRRIDLSAKEWCLLELFVRHRGAVVDRATITAYVWDENHDPASNALEVLVRRLRSKIDDGFAYPLIETLRGAGYRFGL